MADTLGLPLPQHRPWTEPSTQYRQETFEALTFVGGPGPVPVLFPRLTEEPVLLDYLFFQLPRLSSKLFGAHPGIFGARLRPLQLVTDGGDLLDPLPQGGVLVPNPRLEHSFPPSKNPPSEATRVRSVLSAPTALAYVNARANTQSIAHIVGRPPGKTSPPPHQILRYGVA